jgi:hypothetical protein
MELYQYSNPVYQTPDNDYIVCEITHPVFGKIPYNAHKNDVEPLCVAMYNHIVENAQTVPIAPYVAPVVPLSEQATVALGAGVTINFTAYPTLNSLYSCDQTAQNNITSTVLYITINNSFPGKQQTLTWYDKGGNAKVFTDVQTFQKFASAIADYVMELTHIIMSNSGTLPASTITI